MDWKFGALVAGALSVLAGVAALAFLASRSACIDATPEVTAHRKVYRTTIAEDVKIGRHGVYGVDMASCKACRMEKMKRGIFTFGGMNVLVLDELSVVLPPKEPSQGAGEDGERDEVRALARHMGMTDGFFASQGVAARFSGLRINGLSVSRLVDGNNPKKAFAAQTAEAVRGGLKLKGCIIYADGGSPHPVSGAMLARAGGKFSLSWDGGRMDLN